MAFNQTLKPKDKDGLWLTGEDSGGLVGGQTGTPISGPKMPAPKDREDIRNPRLGEPAGGGVGGNGLTEEEQDALNLEIQDWLDGQGEDDKKDGGKKGGGFGGGLSQERQQRKGDLAQQIADAYARSQKPGAATWQDDWQGRIDAMYGDRYKDYESRYQPQMDALMDRLLNRGDFAYNWSDDPLYRQYAARYAQQARQGMQDTMGQAAALTGGYGSSYATAAGQQAYANQMAGLNDRAMDLYQLAKDRYDTQGSEMRSNLSALTGLEDRNRSMYDTDRSTYYQRQDADLANLRDSQSLAYQMYQDQLARELQERQMAWDMYQYWNNLYEDKYLK
ncbi:MAG: hypothetical protein IKS31_01345 [Clostridia bacterium]|nr:hypothetical protein [Clostridia bacterium]